MLYIFKNATYMKNYEKIVILEDVMTPQYARTLKHTTYYLNVKIPTLEIGVGPLLYVTGLYY